MDFEDTPEEADFRAEVRAWLAKTAPAFSGGVGGLMRSVRSPEELAKAKQWQAQKAEARKKIDDVPGDPINEAAREGAGIHTAVRRAFSMALGLV